MELAEIFPCRGRIMRIHEKHSPYLLQVLRPNKQINQKGTEICCKKIPESYLYFGACKKHRAIWKLQVGEPPIRPTHQPNWRWVIYFAPSGIRTLVTSTTMYSACTLQDVPAEQGLPNGPLLLKGLLGKKWKGLARWFKSPIPTDPGLKLGNF